MSERDALTAVQELVAKSQQDEKTIATLRAENLRLQADHHALGEWPKCRFCTNYFVQDQAGAAENATLRDEIARLRAELGEIGMFVAARLPEAKGGDAIEATAGREAGSEAVATPPRSDAGPGRHPFSGARVGGNCVTCGFHFEAPLHQPPSGFEWGEYREPNPRVDSWLSESGVACGPDLTWIRRRWGRGPRHILRPVAKWQPEWQGHDFSDDGTGRCDALTGTSGYLLDRCRKLRAEHANVIRDPRCVKCGETVVGVTLDADAYGTYTCPACYEHGPRPEVKP